MGSVSMSAVDRKEPNPTPLFLGCLILIGLFAAFLLLAVPMGERAAGRSTTPLTAGQSVMDLTSGKHPWTENHTVGTILWVGIPLLLVIAGLIAYSVMRPKRERIDRAARYMGKGKEIAAIRRPAVAKKAKRLGVKDTEYPGIILGDHVVSGERLFASFEDTMVDIWGPRAGKSSSRAIPMILTAPGPVLATSNKPDLFQETNAIRGEAGTVYLFDPQRICGGITAPNVFFNPLAAVREIEDAKDLARVFEQTTAETGAKKDAFFSTAGEQIITDYLLAAGISGQYLSVVFEWVNDPESGEPASILTRHGFPSIAARVKTTQDLPEKTRGGVYAEARRIISFLESRRLLEWLVPGPGRKEFDPNQFVKGNDTLYLLSQEGAGSAGPIIAALTKAVFNAGEEEAAHHPSGRLKVPLLAVLDEAANICRIRDLPDKYSHYGSKGIIPDTILQSYEQGEEAWGEQGMAKMWSAANVRIYGGNTVSDKFLATIERLIGTYDFKESQVTHGRDGRTTTYQSRNESILTVSDLAAVPQSRMIIMAGECKPTLARTIPWFKDKKMTRLVKEAKARAKNKGYAELEQAKAKREAAQARIAQQASEDLATTKKRETKEVN